MSYNKHLQQSLQLGDLTLNNRVIVASMTRNRGKTPNQDNIDYYTQRASSGLILSESILIEPQGVEWLEAPGIWNQEQIDGWKKLTDSVHQGNGKIFAQLWHAGRAANALHNAGVPPPAPSAIKASGGSFRLLIDEPGYSVPKAIENPKYYIQMFQKAAINAKQAGFDGIELHASGGFLVHQFLESRSNQRTDEYGGNVENRAKFLLEIIDEFVKIYPPSRVGIKLSPCGGYNDMGEKNQEEAYKLYNYVITQLDQRNIGYIQLVRYNPNFDSNKSGINLNLESFFRLIKNAKIFINGGFSAEEGNQFIEDNKADAIVYGRPFVANPDLPNRFFNNYELSPIKDYFSLYNYSDGKRYVGYSDYANYS
ncbi:FMN-linked oxidoreductase [Neoconidiobolus thromboides FSU 785]|nr:FMN-linked oxidoreductase [Neoconidiobolus thromboides FSU 785]